MLTVLIATGGSAHSMIAVKMGVYLATLLPVDITLLTVVGHEDQMSMGADVLEKASYLFTDVSCPLHTVVRIGHAPQEIVGELENGRYDLLLMGERMHHDLMSRLLGPTALYVIDHATHPVLLAKHDVLPLKHLLLCDSGTRTPKLLDRFFERLPQFFGLDIDMTVLHVMSQISAGPGVSGQVLRADAGELMEAHSPEGELLADDLQFLNQYGVQARAKVRHGLVVDEIMAEAESENYDLIVIGSHRYEGWQRFLLDDLAHKIVKQAERPLLVIC
ncbi:MAG: universal stress protein [Anaerolineae bacterium]|nr:universal stress protein [Anaerolineae bacterium]